MEPVVRLIAIELNHFKNVDHGEIKFSNYRSVEKEAEILKTDVLGIYGQNGSGKTAVVEALDIVKNVMAGEAVPFDEYSGLLNLENETVLRLFFFINAEENRYKVEYQLHLGVNNALISIPFEQITFWTRAKTWKSLQSVSISNPYYTTGIVATDEHATVKVKGSSFSGFEFLSDPDKLAVLCASQGRSFFFNSSVLKLFSKNSDFNDFKNVIIALNNFAQENFFVIKVRQLADINSSQILPLNVKDKGEGYAMYGCIPLVLNGTGSLPKPIYEDLGVIVTSVNIALKGIIPDLKLEFEKVGEQTDPKGITWCKVDMFSERAGRRFSTKYESEGIKRIISLLSCLVPVFNNPGTTLVVDELDSGIFEYLLGQILSAFENEAKGQLIFTSHNLRAFEKLSNECIVCSTTNPENRYVRLVGIGSHNNKRDFYIRALALGGQNENLYEGDDLVDLGYAFHKAGRES